MFTKRNRRVFANDPIIQLSNNVIQFLKNHPQIVSNTQNCQQNDTLKIDADETK